MTNIQLILLLNALTAVTASVSYSISSIYCYSVLGISVATLSFLDGFSEALSNIIKIFDGIFRDVTKRNKLILVVGLFLGLLSKIFLLGSVFGFVFLVASRLSERLSNGFVAIARDVAISEINENDLQVIQGTKKTTTSLFSLTTTFRNIGCVIGSFAVGAYLSFSCNYTLLISLSALPACLAFAAGISIKNTTKTEMFKVKEAKIKIKETLHNKKLLLIMPLLILFLFARYNDSLMILRIKTLGYSDAFCSSIIGIFNLIGLASSYLWYLKTQSAKNCEKKHLNALWYAISFGFLVNNMCLLVPELAVLSTGLWGIQRALSSIFFPVCVSMLVPKTIRGTAFGVVAVVTAVMSIISGSIYATVVSNNYDTAFILSNIFVVLCTFYYNFYFQRRI